MLKDMKFLKFSIVVLCVLFAGVSCVSKKGAYVEVDPPRVVEKVIHKTDTVFIVKHDTVRVTDVRVDTLRVVVEKPAPVEDKGIRVTEEKIRLAEGENNPDAMKLKYHVVVGSFGQRANADKLQASFRPEYNPMIVVNEKGMFRVILLSFDTKDEAKAAVKQLLGREDLKGKVPADTWVLSQKQ